MKNMFKISMIILSQLIYIYHEYKYYSISNSNKYTNIY